MERRGAFLSEMGKNITGAVINPLDMEGRFAWVHVREPCPNKTESRSTPEGEVGLSASRAL